MKDFSINLNKAIDGHPVSIEVSAKYAKQIMEHIRKVVPVNDLQLNDRREGYSEKGMDIVRFTLRTSPMTSFRRSPGLSGNGTAGWNLW